MRVLIRKLWTRRALRLYYLHLITLTLTATLNFILYARLWLAPGFISYGDTNYMFLPESYSLQFKNLLNTYNQDVLTPKQGFWYSLLFTFFIHTLGSEIGHRLFLYTLLIVASFVIYYGFFRLFRDYFSLTRAWILALIAMMFAFYNFYNGLLQSLGGTFGVSVIFTPYAIYFLIARKLTGRDFLVLFLLFILCNAQPIPIVYSAVLILIALVFHALNKSMFEGIKRIIFYIILLIVSSTYYLLPTIVIYYVLHYHATAIPYTKAIVTYKALKFLSPLNIVDLLFIGQHSRVFFQYHPGTRSPQNILPLIISLTPLFFIKRVQKRLASLIISIYMFLTVTIFLSKGVNPPLGDLYFHLVQVLPSPAAAFLRNPAKFTMLYVYSIAILISLGISLVYDALRMKTRKRIATMIAIALALVVIVISFNTLLVKLNYYTFANFGPHQLPKPYMELYTYLSDSNRVQHFTRAAAFPIGGAYLWTRGNAFLTPHAILSGFPCTLLPVECYPLNKYLDQIPLLNFKYIVLHNDTYSVLKKRNTIMYKELAGIADRYSIDKKVWCSYISETYYRISFKYRVVAPKPLDGFRVELSFTSSNVRSDVWKARVSELFMSRTTKSITKENNLFIVEGNASFEISYNMLNVYSTAYSKPLSIYIDPYSGGFKNIIPNPLLLGAYNGGNLILNHKIQYLNTSLGVEVNIDIADVAMKNKPLKWCIELYKLNTTPINIYEGEILKSINNSTVIKGIGDVYKVRAIIPANISNNIDKLIVTLPFTFDKASMWIIRVYVNDNVADFKVLNISNVIGIEISTIDYMKSISNKTSMSLEILLVNKVFLSFIVGLAITLLTLIAPVFSVLRRRLHHVARRRY